MFSSFLNRFRNNRVNNDKYSNQNFNIKKNNEIKSFNIVHYAYNTINYKYGIEIGNKRSSSYIVSGDDFELLCNINYDHPFLSTIDYSIYFDDKKVRTYYPSRYINLDEYRINHDNLSKQHRCYNSVYTYTQCLDMIKSDDIDENSKLKEYKGNLGYCSEYLKNIMNNCEQLGTKIMDSEYEKIKKEREKIKKEKEKLEVLKFSFDDQIN